MAASEESDELSHSAILTSLVTLNIENFNTNKLFLDRLFKQNDIVCIQEHWLYNFEKHNLEIFSHERGFDCFLKCSDDMDPLSPLQRPRGKGGVGILWRQALSSNIKVLPDGSDRVCAVICESLECGRICIINV
ncbi:MAG: endonuclease/exonuclease/phosphatase family protein, partial [Candidatus Thiodiazotropha sp.]